MDLNLEYHSYKGNVTMIVTKISHDHVQYGNVISKILPEYLCWQTSGHARRSGTCFCNTSLQPPLSVSAQVISGNPLSSVSISCHLHKILPCPSWPWDMWPTDIRTLREERIMLYRIQLWRFQVTMIKQSKLVFSNDPIKLNVFPLNVALQPGSLATQTATLNLGVHFS